MSETDSLSEPLIWLNGSLVKQAEARISPFDHGLLTGDGVFETLRSYDGQPFALSRHWERLKHSAAALELSIPDLSTCRKAIFQLLDIHSTPDARIRITVTGGIAPLGSEKGTSKDTWIIAVSDLPERAAMGRLITIPYRRNEFGALAGCKTTSYGENVRALAMAKRDGANEALFCNTAGHLCEGTGSNLFYIRQGQLHTPSLESGCLAGVTRSVVLEICQTEGITVDESPQGQTFLHEAEEAFLTSTIREIQPLQTLDNHPLPHCPGPVTKKISESFSNFVRAAV